MSLVIVFMWFFLSWLLFLQTGEAILWVSGLGVELAGARTRGTPAE